MKQWSTIKKLIWLWVVSAVREYSGAIVTFFTNVAKPLKNLIIHLQPIQEGSGTPSPDNVRPITGRTGANVYRTGKNLLPSGGAFDVTVNGIRFVSDGNGTYTINGKATANAVYEFDIQEITLPLNVYLHMLNNALTYNMALVFLDGPTQITAPTPVPVNAIKDLSAQLGGRTVNKLRLYVADGYTANMTLSPMLCIDNTTTAYEPYQVNTYSIDWTSEAGTVYGGTLDVVSGVLTVNMTFVDLGSLNWTLSAGGANIFTVALSDMKYSADIKAMCSMYPFKGTISQSSDAPRNGDKTCCFYYQPGQLYRNFYVYDTAYSDVASFKTAMNGVQLCYELATPVTYQLTQQEVQTLVGQNVVWSDAEEVTIRL